MFKIGDKVSWQTRNQGRSNKHQPSFYQFEGVIVDVDTLTAEFRFTGRDDQGRDCIKVSQQQFRQLRNGQYIAKQEDRDDPKGRLYLQLIGG